MKKIFLTLYFIALFTCGMAQQIIRGESFAKFNKVELIGAIRAEFIKSDTTGIEMELGAINSKNITWGVTNGTLTIKLRPDAKAETERLFVKLYYNNMEELTANGAEVSFINPLTSEIFMAQISSGAKFMALVDCVDFELKVTGNSVATVSGVAKYCTITANQRSKVDGRDLQSMSVTARAMMTSEISVYGTERIVAETNTSSVIFYRGNPRVLKSSTRLGGDIQNIGN